MLAAGPEIVKTIGQTHPKTLLETVVYAFPSSVMDAMARGDVLQIVAFAVLFAMAVSAVGEKGKPIVRGMESLSQVMFKFTNYVMMFAPIGVGAAMAHTVGTQGLGVLLNLGNLILTLYLGLIIFVVLVFGLVILIVRVPVRQFVRAVRNRPRSPSRRRAANRRYRKRCRRWNDRCPAPHRRVRHADRILVQPRWLDAVSREASVFVAQAAEDDHGTTHGHRSADHDDAALMLTRKAWPRSRALRW